MNFIKKNIYIFPVLLLIPAFFYLNGCSASENIYYQNGLKNYDAGDMKNALIEFDKALTIEPDNK